MKDLKIDLLCWHREEARGRCCHADDDEINTLSTILLLFVRFPSCRRETCWRFAYFSNWHLHFWRLSHTFACKTQNIFVVDTVNSTNILKKRETPTRLFDIFMLMMMLLWTLWKWKWFCCEHCKLDKHFEKCRSNFARALWPPDYVFEIKRNENDFVVDTVENEKRCWCCWWKWKLIKTQDPRPETMIKRKANRQKWCYSIHPFDINHFIIM